MVDFDKEVERFCRLMCQELDIDPEPTYIVIGRKTNIDQPGWKRFEKHVADFLEMQAFARIKNAYWEWPKLRVKEEPPKQELLLEVK